VWYVPTTGTLSMRAAMKPTSPTGPGVEMCMTSGRSLSAQRSIRRSGGRTVSSCSYFGMGMAKTGSKFLMLGESGTLKRVEVTTVRFRLVSPASLATFWMKRETPLTSPSVSVNWRTFMVLSRGELPSPGVAFWWARRSSMGRSLFWWKREKT